MRYILFLLLISGCKSETTTESTSDSSFVNPDSVTAVPEVYEPIDGQANEVSIGSEIFQFENDEVGGDPFARDFDAMVAALPAAEIVKKPFRNVHDSTQTDTLVLAKFGPSTIEYYKIQKGGGFILEARIQSDDVDFKKGIRIGMSRSEFFSLFDELQGKPPLKSVIITTMEGLNQTEFEFAGDVLTTVTYQSYFD